MHKQYHLQINPIPPGFRIYEDAFEIRGVPMRRSAVAAFCKEKSQSLELEAEPRNIADSNAIAVFGRSKWLFFNKRRQLGYLPREIAARLTATGTAYLIMPRLHKTYVGSDGFTEVTMQLIGPVDAFNRYTSKTDSPKTKSPKKTDAASLQPEDIAAAENDLLLLIEQDEKDAVKYGGVAGRNFEALAKLYRRARRKDEEIALLERFAAQKPARGKTQEALLVRLQKLKSGS